VKVACVAVSVAALVLVSASHGASVAQCRTADLHIWVTRTGAALGTVGDYLAFMNHSHSPAR